MAYYSFNNFKKGNENQHENIDKIQEKDDILEKFMDDVMSSDLSYEIKSNLAKMVEMSKYDNKKEDLEKGDNTKGYNTISKEKNKKEEQVKREEKRISRLNILERVIKEIDIDQVHKKEVKLVEKIREKRFKDGKQCPHCGCKKCWKYGTYSGKQRYKCSSEECGKTFSDFTFSPMYCSKKGMNTWIEYMKCMVKGLSLKISSEIVGINIATAFYWRHKILDGLRNYMGKGCVGGIVEMGHMIVVESIKGDKNTGRKRGIYKFSRRCGVKNKQALIGAPGEAKRNFVICAVDRDNNMIVEASNSKRLDMQVLEAVFSGSIYGGAVVCVVGNRYYHQFVEDMGLSIGRSNIGDDNGQYHLGNIMDMKREINQWLASFNGVSSKYLTNYLYWYRWMKEKGVYNGHGDHCEDNEYMVAESLFIESHSKYTGMVIKEFKVRKPMYVKVA